MEFAKFSRIPFLREQATSVVLSGFKSNQSKVKKHVLILDVNPTMQN